MTQQQPPAPPQGQPGWGPPQGPPPQGWQQGQPWGPPPETNKRPWFKKKRFIIPLVLLALMVLGSALGGSDPDTNSAGNSTDNPPAAAPLDPAAPVDDAPAAEAPAPAPAPAAITTSAKEMIEMLEGNAVKAKNTYDDKTVTVTGFVGSLDASGDYFALDPEPEALIFTGIQVQTSEKFQDQIANFTKGQPITVTGKITNVGEVMGYTLKAETIQ